MTDEGSPADGPQRLSLDPDRLTVVATAHVARNVESVAALHAHAEEAVDPHQRRVERVTLLVARPLTLYILCGGALAWGAFNVIAPRFGMTAPDPAPFFWLQGLVSFGALLITTMVLTSQSRVARVVEKRAHLELQVNMLAEQKVAKLIALVEELRRDLPNVPDRVDPIAQAMARSLDAEHVLEVIEEEFEAANPRA